MEEVAKSNTRGRETGFFFGGEVGFESQWEKTLVLVEEWPSLVLVLDSLGWKRVICLTKEKMKSKSFWKMATRGRYQSGSWSEWLRVCQDVGESGGLVWLQGSA